MQGTISGHVRDRLLEAIEARLELGLFVRAELKAMSGLSGSGLCQAARGALNSRR